jgi:sugar/nucleoside kinase (ribokinase family)
MPPVAVLGNLALDRIDGGSPQPGGGPFHAARALRAMNRPSLVVARCAAADRAVLVPALVRLGVPVLWRDSATTARFSIEYKGEGERAMAIEELGSPWNPEDAALGTALARVDWLHVAPLARSDFPAETLSVLGRGRRISLDGQGLVRPACTGPLKLDADYDPELLRSASILKLAEEEAHALFGEPTESALRSLGVPEVVVTLGPRGSIVYADGLAEHVSTKAVLGPRDPTGAGDAFAVAYLVARSGSFSPPAAARWASGVVAGLLSGRLK